MVFVVFLETKVNRIHKTYEYCVMQNQNLTGIQPDKHSTCVNIALNILLQIVVALLNLKTKIIDITALILKSCEYSYTYV